MFIMFKSWYTAAEFNAQIIELWAIGVALWKTRRLTTQTGYWFVFFLIAFTMFLFQYQVISYKLYNHDDPGG